MTQSVQTRVNPLLTICLIYSKVQRSVDLTCYLLSCQHFTEPLDVVTFLNQIRPEQESLRRFSYVSYEEPMPSTVKCSYDGCTFEAASIDQMTDHQASAQHPGWGNLPAQPDERSWVCGKCGNTFNRQGTLYVHLATHSLPFSCSLCPYKAGRQNRLKTHMETKHGKKLDTSNRWSLQNKQALTYFVTFITFFSRKLKASRKVNCGHSQCAYKATKSFWLKTQVLKDNSRVAILSYHKQIIW